MTKKVNKIPNRPVKPEPIETSYQPLSRSEDLDNQIKANGLEILNDLTGVVKKGASFAQVQGTDIAKEIIAQRKAELFFILGLAVLFLCLAVLSWVVSIYWISPENITPAFVVSGFISCLVFIVECVSMDCAFEGFCNCYITPKLYILQRMKRILE